jgi:hypothetical protein
MNIEKYKPLVLKQLNRFHFKYARTKWLDNTFFSVYLRKGLYEFENNKYPIITIANIQVKEEYQNKGFFKLLLLCIKEMNVWTYIKVECVHSEILRDYLIRNNWEKINNGESFIIKINYAT